MRRFENATGGNHARQTICAMAAIADEAIANVTAAMRRRGLWERSHLVLLSDNGGPTNGNEGTQSNNFPMRGGKNTLWEGGTRVMAAMRGPAVGAPLIGTISYEQVHVTDWMPTLLSLALAEARGQGNGMGGGGGMEGTVHGDTWRALLAATNPPYLDGDGMDISATLATGVAVRTETLLETHPPPAPWHAYVRVTRGGNFTHHDGYLPVGDDWRPAEHTSVGACLDKCLAENECMAATFTDPEERPARATNVKCYLKAHVHRIVPRSGDQVR